MNRLPRYSKSFCNLRPRPAGAHCSLNLGLLDTIRQGSKRRSSRQAVGRAVKGRRFLRHASNNSCLGQQCQPKLLSSKLAEPGNGPTVVVAMLEMPSEADVHCSAETIFDLITDFQSQDRWLTKSSAFHGTNDISSNPVTLGTSYREPGPFGVRNGRVTEFVRPTKITFYQPMSLRLHSGTVDVTVRYTLTAGAGSTNVRRVVTIAIPWHLKLLQPVLVREFRVESARTLLALKAYADKLH